MSAELEEDASHESDKPRRRPRFPVVGIGASAGGLEAFTQLLGALPADTGMGFVLIQHLDPDHESQLTQILARSTALPVHEIENDQRVEANHIHVIPRDANLTIVDGVFKIRPRPRTRTPHRPIDSFFESLAQDVGEWAIGVVLSGTGSDGTLGLEAIKAEGGITFAQDDSARHNAMPRSAVAAGCVDLTLSPADIAAELARISKHPYIAGQAPSAPAEDRADPETVRLSATTHEDDSTPLPSGGSGTPPIALPGDESSREQEIEPADAYKKILLLLRNHSGVDFSLYKSTTIQRRINRRLVLSHHNALDDYAAFLRGNAKELDTLYSDVLISVTSFFRNPEAFDVLQQTVLPALLDQPGSDPLRCWVLGCSTGQEAYSIAMAFAETVARAPRMRKLQIFATDLNDALLEKARHALYAKTLAEDISPERLRQFFVEEEGGYRVTKAIRETVVFARQNLIADPPFSRMDLISCRNLLIYLEPSLQKKAIPTFHYALKPGGFLLLGASESISGFTELFEPASKKHKIYSKKPAPMTALHLPVRTERGQETDGARPLLPILPPGRPELPEGLRSELDAQREADRITVHEFAPPAVLVNAELQVLQFRGPTSAFLEPPLGKASFDVLKMAREGLMLPLRSTINQAKKDNRKATKQGVRVKRDGKTRTVNIEVVPLKNLRERCFLIFFEEAGKAGPRTAAIPAPAPAGRRSVPAELRRIAELEAEMVETREYLQSMREQHEAAMEEVQSSNEEVQSANEELQSVNEELETSKEELESTNEELTTVNDEMSARNTELNRLNNDLVNLQTSTRLSVLLLGRDLAIRRFSPQAEKQFDLLVADVGRPLNHIRHGLVDGAGSPLDLEALASEVIAEVREQEREVLDKAGRWHSLRVRPYMTLDAKVDGAVLVLVDIDGLIRAEMESARLASIVTSSDDAIISIDLEGVIRTWNRAAERLYGYAAKEVIGQPAALLVPTSRGDEEPALLTRVARGEAVEHYETVRQRKDGSLLDVSLTVSPVRDSGGRITGAAKIARDITERKENEQRLRRSAAELAEVARRKNEFLAMLGHELRNPLSAAAMSLEVLGSYADDPARSEELRARIVRQIKRMGAILDQLLDMARVTGGKIEISKQWIDLADVVRAAVETVRPLVDAQKHELTLTLPEQGALVMGDPVRLTQLVDNLLTNAAKYTNEGGEIELSLEYDTTHARITVRDNGIGMSADLIPHIFEVFTQAPRSLDRAKGGLGLGLPLVQRVAEMHGGRVDVSSPGPGQGSEFVVSLPRGIERARPDQPEGTHAADEPSKVEPRQILVVDDEEDGGEGLATLLKMHGHRTLVVKDGPSALEAARTFHPEVVLLDIGLPEMDGYEVAKKLRQEHADGIRLIAVTGYAKDSARLEQAGFDGHLLKPPDIPSLLSLIAATAGGDTAS